MGGTLARWARESPADERRTVVLRPESSVALDVAERTKRPRAVRVVADIDPYEVL